MRNFRTEGIIIKRRNLGEADRIITVFTPAYGKLLVKAAGVRKITSRRSAHIELLNRATLNLYKGKGMHVLTEVKMVDDYAEIKNEFTKIGIAYHLCELIDSLCPENQEHGNVFQLLKDTLRNISLNDQRDSYLSASSSDIDDYMLGTFGLGIQDSPRSLKKSSDLIQQFELRLLAELGYCDKQDDQIDTQALIESIIERKLKSRQVFAKLQ